MLQTTNNAHQGDPAIKSFMDTLASSASQVLSQALGTKWEVKQGPSNGGSTLGSLTLLVTGSQEIEGAFAITLPRGGAARLVAAFIGSPETESVQWSSEMQEGVEELFRQILGELVTQLKPQTGPNTFQLSAGTLQSPAASEICVTASSALVEIPMTVAVNESFIKSLRSLLKTELPPSISPEFCPPDRNLELLMDVELGATLRFGSTKMPLRDILKLASGSVIELDRRVHEPVELLLEGKIVARGEVVIVDGAYGLRITDVAASTENGMQ